MSRRDDRVRPEHPAKGDPCERCGSPAKAHRPRYRKGHRGPRPKPERVFLGIDGEGQGKDVHRYVLLAYASKDGKREAWVENPAGLSTVQCLDFILSTPQLGRLFAYAFGYDLAKILQDLPDEKIFILFRPEERARVGVDDVRGPRAIRWGPYLLNLQGTKFSVARIVNGKMTRKRIVWDVIKFFQSKFVGALESWNVGTEEVRARIAAMKAKRSDFDRESPDAVRAYCLEECRYMAELAERLVGAHEDVGLKLRSFYGAGSTGGAMLKTMGIHKQERRTPDAMRAAVAGAFFGGRFEHSVIGPVRREVWGYDISSAYPYQITFLPCLEHARWELTNSRHVALRSRAALVHYRVRAAEDTRVWGPFPYRLRDGSIVFPGTSPGGWVWGEEFFSGEALFSGVQFREAWVLRSDCECQPFARVPEFYLERLKWGKEGRGIVLKLGCNSCYGKLAQSVGNAPFQSWIWAGMTTSGCRAQILDAMACAKRLDSILAVATDGIYARERLHLPRPIDTGTYDTGKPLGGWEEKRFPKGMFFMRPGVYWPLGAKTPAELKHVRGRGVGKAVMIESQHLAERAWREKAPSVTFPSVSRFHGSKSSVHRILEEDKYTGERSFKYIRHETYGQWTPYPIELSFNPMPKRLMVRGSRLVMRRIAGRIESCPYDRAVHSTSPDALTLKALTDIRYEQPDGGEGDNWEQYEGDRA